MCKNGETLLGAVNFFVSSINTLVNKTMEDTLMTIKMYENARYGRLNRNAPENPKQRGCVLVSEKFMKIYFMQLIIGDEAQNTFKEGIFYQMF